MSAELTTFDVTDYAKAYVTNGWRTIPVVYGDKQPAVKGWQDLVIDVTNVEATFGAKPTNIGVLLGKKSGNLVDVDIDDDWALRLAKSPFLPETGCVFGRASRPGSHRIYTCEAKTRKYENPATGKVILEIRSDGAQTVFPPSIHPSGEEVEFDLSLDLKAAPVDAGALQRACGQVASTVLIARCWPSGPSNRQDRARALAGALLGSGLPAVDALSIIVAAAHLAGDGELTKRKEAVKTAEARIASKASVWGWPKVEELFGAAVAKALRNWLELPAGTSTRSPVPAPKPTVTVTDIEKRISGLSSTSTPEEVTEVIEEIAGAGFDPLRVDELLKQVAETSDWDLPTLKRAMPKRAVSRRADVASRLEQIVLDEYFAQGRHLVYGADRRFWVYSDGYWSGKSNEIVQQPILEALERHEPTAAGSKAAILRNVLSVLQIRQAADSGTFSLTAKPKPIINVKNGELWLRSDGTIDRQSHKPESHLTYRLDVEYQPGATCPIFDQVLMDIFAKSTDPAEMSRHFNEFFGYAIQPVRDVPSFFLLHGGGSNGKSALMTIVRSLMGANAVYAQRVDALATSQFSIGHLAGKLLLLDDDVDIGTRLPDGLIKKISEEKLVTSERKFGDTFDFYCSALPVFLCNNYPLAADVSKGFLRRANVIPFARTFEDHEKKPGLFKHILTHELPGVLNRALEGLQRLRAREHFAPPQDCREATVDWLRHANPLPEFIHAACEVDPAAAESLKKLYQVYRVWAHDNGIRSILPNKMLKSNLEHLGYKVVKHGGYSVVRGLKLKPVHAV